MLHIGKISKIEKMTDVLDKFEISLKNKNLNKRLQIPNIREFWKICRIFQPKITKFAKKWQIY